MSPAESQETGFRTRHAVDSTAAPEQLWALVAQPHQWSRWSPYVLGADGLGSPDVEAGATGELILRGGIKVPAEITEVVPGRSWSWRVGGVVVHHIVESTTGGSRLVMPVEATGRAWTLPATLYAPVVGLIARRIVRMAERESPPV